MKKQLTTTMALIAIPLAVLADSGQIVSVNGTTVNKTVKEITFSGTDVALSFTDGTTQTADMSTVNIAFGTATGIKAVSKDAQHPADGRIYSISGQYMGKDKNKLPKGIYIINGKKEIKK
ncbi:hypothetical protein PRLR6025_02940 [Prevotella lacticifex]|uniref:subtilase n=1 Tax=Prevotella lacticifex TaxID=2854755 RepID=UPI001CC5CD60|nr:subtilase [Prevotella lacticifex]GJG66825.1 hypothetical protein PRLR6025_02940 [Prevotella lacticifex]